MLALECTTRYVPGADANRVHAIQIKLAEHASQFVSNYFFLRLMRRRLMLALFKVRITFHTEQLNEVF